jgi:hypothetical protein
MNVKIMLLIVGILILFAFYTQNNKNSIVHEPFRIINNTITKHNKKKSTNANNTISIKNKQNNDSSTFDDLLSSNIDEKPGDSLSIFDDVSMDPKLMKYL